MDHFPGVLGNWLIFRARERLIIQLKPSNIKFNTVEIINNRVLGFRIWGLGGRGLGLRVEAPGLHKG